MAYTTKGGNLAGHETWTAGTYYLSSGVNLNGFNLTLNAAGGDIYIKCASHIVAFTIAASCTFSTSNTSSTNRIYISSMNDNTIGEEIVGSSGSPARGDYYQALDINADSVTVNLSYVEIRYSHNTVDGRGVLVNTPSAIQASTSITYNYVSLYDCGCGDVVKDCAFIGTYNTVNRIASFTLNNIFIDSSCVSTDRGYAILCYTSAPSITNVCIEAECFAGIYIGFITTTTSSATINNFSVRNYRLFGIDMDLGDNNSRTIYIKNCTAIAKDASAYYGIRSCNYGPGLLTAIISNCIATGGQWGYEFNAASGPENVTLNNCGAYGYTTARTRLQNGALCTDNNPINADPQLGNLPASCVIDTDNCPFSDGVAVRNLINYEKMGSDTYTNLSIDPAIYSATGKRYSGSDMVTPGIQYALEKFQSKPKAIVVVIG